MDLTIANLRIHFKRSLPTLILALALAVICPSFPSAAVAGPGKPFTLPPYEKYKLPNGLTVYLMEHRAVPLIYAVTVFPDGAVRDGGKGGLAYLTAESLFSGTKNYSKKELEEKLEYLGADYSAYTGLDAVGIALSFLNTHQDLVFPIIKEVIRGATFPPGEFNKRKRLLLEEIVQAKEQPAQVLDDYFRAFVFGERPYGNPLRGTYRSVSKIGFAEVRAFYLSFYGPEGAALIFVGNFSTSRMKEIVQKHFGDWRGKGKPPVPPATQPPPVFTAPRVLLVDKSDATETRFAFGGLGVPRSHPDYVALQVVNTILGGRFTSWLSDTLRVDAGLTYSIASISTPSRPPAPFRS